MAYTECTSLIGTPSIDGVQQSIRARMHLQKIVTFVLTVGLSGFLLLAVQQCHKGKEKDYSPLIEQTNKGIEEVQKGLGEILKEMSTFGKSDQTKISLLSTLEKLTEKFFYQCQTTVLFNPRKSVLLRT